jgi:hypothetical protein
MKFSLASVFGVVLLLALSFSPGCGNGPGSANCPTCGTTSGGIYRNIDVIPVPEHNPTGEPGGPFNSFDISVVDSVNHRFYVSDRIGLDIPVFDTLNDIALTAIGGDNTVATGFTPSPCIPLADGVTQIPATLSGEGSLTRFGCRTKPTFTGIGAFGASGDFGGFPGAQCCASRSNAVNPMGGPDGEALSPDNNFLFIGNGSSTLVVFDLRPMLAGTGPATVIANIPTGASADYDGLSIAECIASWNGGAGSGFTCGDDRADELSVSTPVKSPIDGAMHTFVMIDNGDPGLPLVTVFDVTQVLATGTQANCMPPNPALPFSPGPGPAGGANVPGAVLNMPQCMMGQLYFDGLSNSPDDASGAGVPADFQYNDLGTGPEVGGLPCPDASVFFNNNPGTPEPSGNMGGPSVVLTADGSPVTTPCFHMPVAPAGLGGSTWNPNTGHFLTVNPNNSPDPHFGEVDEVDPFGFATGKPVVNELSVIECMPASVVVGPGTDALVGCANHDGMAFPPSMIIINGTTLAEITTTFFVGGVDEIWYNPGDNHYYLAARDMPNGPQMGVIDAGKREWLVNVPTGSNSHSISVDSSNNHIFVPLQAGAACAPSQSSNGCVGVFARE